MLRIDCPFCGPRDEVEFRCGGQSHIQRPGPHDAVGDVQWSDYLFIRDNPRGWHAECWYHVHGCRQWFNLERHTVTHEIAAVYAMTAPRPDPDKAGR